MHNDASQEKFEKILAIFFNTNGFGYVEMKSPLDVIQKGIKTFKPSGSPHQWEELNKLIKQTKPDRVILEDVQSEKSHKRSRIHELISQLCEYLKDSNIECSCYDRAQIRKVFETWHAKSKYEIALVLAQSLPAFKGYLYDKPKYPKMEHYRTVVFDAAALGITHYYLTT